MKNLLKEADKITFKVVKSTISEAELEKMSAKKTASMNKLLERLDLTSLPGYKKS
ncbi:hypothetical protein [Dawidia soli]|uniref:Uncharacterized protein n=1 Tax=Dawidia soli TaxID=2782352 RepID=A0AAP2GGJ5_9BACT|nr:hypothetical protein [Dawidia soli]MBT1686196.1 hypothetical protein [Dawidia soli]